VAITVTLQGQIIISDGTTGVVSLQKQLSLVMPGVVFSQAQTLPVGIGATTISLPISPVQFLYLKNLHAANVVTVTWTPSGGASNVVVVLQPGSMIMFTEANPVPGSGITALSLQANVGNTPVEFIVGG
jgi:hypothetical protein